VDSFNLLKSFQPHYGPGVDSASIRTEYQESSWGVKGDWRLRLTTSSPSVSRLSRKMWEHRCLAALWVFTACYRDSFTFFYLTSAHLNGVFHKSLPSVCVSVCVSLLSLLGKCSVKCILPSVARGWLNKRVPAATNTHKNRRNVGRKCLRVCLCIPYCC
jgi:hypothetical protein